MGCCISKQESFSTHKQYQKQIQSNIGQYYTKENNVEKFKQPESKITQDQQTQSKNEQEIRVLPQILHMPSKQISFLSDIDIPEAEVIQQNQLHNSQNNSIFQSCQNKETTSVVNSIDQLDIPSSSIRNNKYSSQDSILQNQQCSMILSSEFMSIQCYKNFCCLSKTNQSLDILASNPFTCFCFLIFELISFNDCKFHIIKNRILKIEQFISNTFTEQQNQYGQIKNVTQMKKLFLQYLIKILNQQSAISIIQNYSVLEFVLQPIVISYVASMINDQSTQNQIKTKYQQRIFDANFFQIVKDSFGLQKREHQNQMVFLQKDKKLQIQLEGDQQWKARIV